MIGIIFLERFYDIPLNDGGMTLEEFVNEYIWIVLPVFFFLFIFSSLIIGFLDTRFGLREEEMRNVSSSNPEKLQSMLDAARDYAEGTLLGINP